MSPFATASLSTRHPLALLSVIAVLGITVVTWLNPYSAIVALAGWFALMLVASPRALIQAARTRLIWGLVVASLTAAVAMALYGQASGQVLWQFGPATVSEGSLQIAAATAIRVLAIGIPSLFVFRMLDLTTLALALEHNLRLPPTVVWGVFAGFRQLQLARVDWRTAQFARRARAARAGTPFGRAFQGAFVVFQLAIERGQELAITLQSRGLRLGSRRPAHPPRWNAADTAIVVAGVAVCIAAAAVAIATGGSVHHAG